MWLSLLLPSITRLGWFNFHALHWSQNKLLSVILLPTPNIFVSWKNYQDGRWSCFVLAQSVDDTRQKNLLSCRDPMCSGTAHWLCIGILVIVGSHFDLSLRFPGGDLDRRGVKLATKYFRRRKQWLCTLHIKLLSSKTEVCTHLSRNTMSYDAKN